MKILTFLLEFLLGGHGTKKAIVFLLWLKMHNMLVIYFCITLLLEDSLKWHDQMRMIKWGGIYTNMLESTSTWLIDGLNIALDNTELGLCYLFTTLLHEH